MAAARHAPTTCTREHAHVRTRTRQHARACMHVQAQAREAVCALKRRAVYAERYNPSCIQVNSRTSVQVFGKTSDIKGLLRDISAPVIQSNAHASVAFVRHNEEKGLG
eukprot:6175791-Pleurochrysis_carterae.AAC.4